ncbi:glutamine synthetase beta-grasp domain-containing protein [Exiguobacterium profundum]|uniref:Glutamine synthetase n=1 Tax=Exiguobacterium sp. (strain ATCC BAA-1283 / AT1b) TaxID=360911 RepID=C4L259_EXISA|nr:MULTISPECIES: glutamine synthetase beta-grasp domain-containing protein [Exiguobacterium]ACQ69233.1 glutamine synthetase catalytic region [Exiguobacterium sp. AT1b]MDX5980892.1 glutamine synthetase beta-grasp domain-containing protein [Exiguobacterium profundum]QUP88494.1 glutamine synthetase beta-grasp domain-containing protein [Exiguobacterium sp. PFWT01]
MANLFGTDKDDVKKKQQDIEKTVQEKNITQIHLYFSDVLGDLKLLTLSAKLLPEVFEGKTMFDGSSINGFSSIKNSDLFLRPDLDRPRYEQDGEENILAFFCDVCTPEGERYEYDPRNVLKDALERAARDGYSVFVGAEPEFFIFDENGEFYDEAGYFSTRSEDKGYEVRQHIANRLSGVGFNIEAVHHEVAPAQHEIGIKYDDALHTADNIQFFKEIVKIAAKEKGASVSFLPKPLRDVNGSGMHLNISVWKNDESGNPTTNAFDEVDSDYGLSKTARHFIEGILKHARATAIFTNPLPESYERLVPGFEAPVNICWSPSNRSSMIRIPASRGSATRVEVRNPDPSANPYLALAALIYAGLEGIEQQLVPSSPNEDDLFEYSAKQIESQGIASLPATFHESIQSLKQDNFHDYFNHNMIDRYLSLIQVRK